VDPDNPFVISNAAFKLNSGFGKYEVDFTSWIQTNGVIASSDKVQNSIIGRFLYFNTVNKKEDVPSFKVNITLGQQGKLQYNYIKEDGTSTYIAYSESGIYTIPASYFSKYTGGNAWFGFYQIEGTSIIEQIPSFEGAFITDGVNDLITSTKTVQEMGITDEVTVVSMIHQIALNPTYNIGTTNYLENLDNGKHIRSDVYYAGKTGIYGYTASLINNTASDIKNILGDKADYSTKKDQPSQTLHNSKFSVVGRARNLAESSSVAWYWTVIANKVLTTDQINQVIAYFNLDRTLNPDILCNITKQGITNDNHADFKDKLIDYSGNGRDIQMYNLAWKGGSGVAAKPYETFKDWTSEFSSTSIITQIDEFTRIVESTTNGYWVSRIRRGSDLDKVYDPINVYLYQDNNFLVHECKYEVDGVKYNIPINEPVGKGYHKLEMYTKDRYTELPENAENIVLSEWYFSKSNKGSIKYSIIPSCKGGILLDGINDFGKVTGMPIYKDYTVVADREIIDGLAENADGGVLCKGESTVKNSFVFDFKNEVYSFAKGNSKTVDTKRFISYQSKYVNNGVNIDVGTGDDTDVLYLAKLAKSDRYSKLAFWSMLLFPYSMSEFLIERQLKKHKLGTLYPDMVEFRPIVKSNLPYSSISYSVNPGEYISVDSMVTITVTLPNTSDKLMEVSCNAISDISISGDNGVYEITGKIVKSPQKINMIISSYLTMLSNSTLISNETLIKNE
jgi:hypothetical protein